jgi:hypothetical protein
MAWHRKDKKGIELQKLILNAKRVEDKNLPIKNNFKGVRIIRRRKGSPDFQIA